MAFDPISLNRCMFKLSGRNELKFGKRVCGNNCSRAEGKTLSIRWKMQSIQIWVLCTQLKLISGLIVNNSSRREDVFTCCPPLSLPLSLSSCVIFTSWLPNRMWCDKVLPGIRRLGHCSSWQCKGRPALVKAFSASPDSLCSAHFKVNIKGK